MNYISREVKVNTAVQVIQRMNDGMNVTEACHAVGMPRSTYYYIINREEEAIAEFQNLVFVNSVENLWKILTTQAALMQKIIEDGLSDSTTPRERLAIHKTLMKRADKLARDLQMHSHAKEFAAEFLKGPTLRLGTSKFANGSTVDVNCMDIADIAE